MPVPGLEELCHWWLGEAGGFKVGIVLSREEARAMAERCGLSQHADSLLALGRAAWRFDRDADERADQPGASKIGGGADLTAREHWPLNADGVPYVLLAQLDCGALPTLDGPWPPSTEWCHGGRLLRIFADCASVDGTDVVVLAADPVVALQRQRRPSLPAPWPYDLPPQDFGLGENALIEEAAVRAVPFVSLPVPGYEATGVMASEPYFAWTTQVSDDPRYQQYAPTTLLGEPIAVQSNPLDTVAYWYEHNSGYPQAADPCRQLADPASWCVLLHLATDDHLGFDYGGGAYTVVVPVVELAVGRYDHATCVWQY